MEHGDLTGAILDGRYRVIEAVAEGAMGIVYRAERLNLGRIVAIKVLHEVLPNELSARKRFEIEARAMAKLEHPHCASVLDVGVHNDRPFVVMDFVSGDNLKDVVATGAQPIARAIEIVRQVLSGLAHAHEHGIIHRDIKPANLVLSHKTGLGDHVKILDFGLARLHDTGQNLTTGIVVGTPAYMAPEQIRGQVLDHRIDLYACGVLLFELLTGEKPFHSELDDPIEVCKMHLSAPIPRLDARRPGVAFGELEAVIVRALAKAADDRFASAHAFAAALDAIAPGRAVRPAMAPLAPSSLASIQLGTADVLPLGDTSYPPAIELRSADVMALSSEPASAPVPAAARARIATPPAGTAPWPDRIDHGRSFLGIAVRPTPVPRAAPPAEPVVAPAAPRSALDVAPAADDVASAAEPRAAASIDRPAPPADRAAFADPAALAAFTNPAAPDRAASTNPAAPADRSTAAPRARRGRAPWIATVVGGAVLAVIAAIAVWAVTAPGAGVAAPDAGVVVAVPTADPSGEVLARVNELVAQGDRDAAIELLGRARKRDPDSGPLAYATGRIFFSKFYWSDGLKGFRDAIRIDPTYRTDPELIKTVLRGFIMTPSYNDEIASFLRDDIGSPARSFLEETARDHPSAAIRSRAAAELRRYR